MKLVKLSLAAAIAAGALVSSASAVALEEAIKDVDLSGMAFVRYQNAKRDGKVHDGNWWKFKSVLTLKTKIDDNFFMLAGFQYGADKDVGSSGGKYGTEGQNNGFDTEGFKVTQALLGYNVGGTTVMVGRYNLGTFFTDDMLGDGIKVVNTDIQGLTLAALWADALQNDSDVLDGKDGAVRTAIAKAMQRDVLSHNLYGVAAIGSYDPLAFQIWYASLQDVANLFAIEAGLNFNITDDITLGVTGQYAFTDMDGDLKEKVPNAADSKFAAGKAEFGAFGFDMSAGYVYYKAKDGKYSLSSLDDNGQFISAGQVMVPDSGVSSYHAYAGKNDYWFVTAGYKIPNTGISFGVDYVDGKFNKGNKVGAEEFKAKEIVGRLGYKYNKKLNFTSWYSYIDYDPEKMVDDKTFRVQAQYKF
ncbi:MULTISPECIES: major outer membrane protein [unclassified Campylobacter]|uniref:major outer membrane protein n=1 Tax=unclassified Campylobacter TaxID=2593542 RepID=UPI0022E9EC35|nr:MULTISPECIES: major outer membrane protein [unclassified Campylobacter]MDA3079579.1 major outer membrane protein [Campylobacter sp. CS_NA2]MDA3080989.1 major outer membrane protein [Campylobacter sp. CS_NA1]MDA3085540.1 major outer membrane protein [Campylobacter sp. CS_ED1]MDA3090412.1 major outer membrane protein [Campylobacter sp. CS_ED2]WBR50806.1 major outer membrane protein [Campylobacter sp. CS_NA3]